MVCGIGHGTWAPGEHAQWGITEWLCCDVTARNLACFRHIPQIVIHCAGSGSVGFAHQQPFA